MSRVCIRMPDGSLRAALATRQNPRAGEWVPVPDSPEGRALAEWDVGRPTGVHPAVWYGWPRGARPDTRPTWTVTGTSGRFAIVPAYSAAAAVLSSGLYDEVEYVEQHAHWF